LNYRLKFIFLFLSAACFFSLQAEDGYRLWLRYDRVADTAVLRLYRESVTAWMIEGNSPTMKAASSELERGLKGLLGKDIPRVSRIGFDGLVIAGTPESSRLIASMDLEGLRDCGREGFLLITKKYRNRDIIVIAANSEIGVLYGVYRFLQQMQMNRDLSALNISGSPAIKLRLLNHWDNLDGSIERGYAGRSLWEWDSLPATVSARYTDYARANASVGINGTVLTNVNANAKILTPEYLVKVAALADVFRPYGIKVYLTARFSAPIETGSLRTADPLDTAVIRWWKEKVAEIYRYIPDFGGFLVKANSEGQPGPQNYGRTHADGANMLAAALKPYGGIVMWRAFVYSNEVPEDRTKQAYNEFVPLDGKFLDNVIIQVKNGPLDFQPREPFHPLFGGMKNTRVMPEFQITQEYLGFSTHLVYLAPLWCECLNSDTRAGGKRTLVSDLIRTPPSGDGLSAIAGVANAGSQLNWTGHPFAQSNWYAFGRLAWDPSLSAEEIAEEWIRMSLTKTENAVKKVEKIMMASREAAVNYMTPIGLHHIMSEGLHYGPGPWVEGGRRDWSAVYYHRADSAGIGFDRSFTGSNAVSQYFPEVASIFNDVRTCPENLLLWFHHLQWDYRMSSGRTLWDELCFKYNSGVDSVRWMQQEWAELRDDIDPERFEKVNTLLQLQKENAEVWRDACLLYFQTFSHRPFPEYMAQPEHPLDYYRKLSYTF
jgi:alpha-glucuronidase